MVEVLPVADDSSTAAEFVLGLGIFVFRSSAVEQAAPGDAIRRGLDCFAV